MAALVMKCVTSSGYCTRLAVTLFRASHIPLEGTDENEFQSDGKDDQSKRRCRKISVDAAKCEPLLFIISSNLGKGLG